MKYSDIVTFNPIESVIRLTAANDSNEAANLVKSYVMSESMADQINANMLSQLRLCDAVDNKGVLLVGNYGTGKSHLMSVISAIALDKENLTRLHNPKFAAAAEIIAGHFEVLRVEIGAVTTSLREIILGNVRKDFKTRGLTYNYPSADSVTGNKDTLREMMEIFGTKYKDKGYLIIVDEFLDFLGGKDDHAVRLDLGFLRELGEIVKESRLRVIFGIQEKLFDNPKFSFVSETINRVRDRFEQVVIRKEDTAYVVSERLLKKNDEQKAVVRDHLQKFCCLYSNMSERLDDYVNLYPIHPSYIDVFNNIHIIENRHILANISKTIGGILDKEINQNEPGIISFDSYWPSIRDNFSYRTDADIKEVVEKSDQLEKIIEHSFPKKLYKPLAVKIIYALSVHRLTTNDIQLHTGLTSENLRDDLCLYLHNMPDQSSDTLHSLVQAVLKDIMTTVSGQFIDYDKDNGQYYLDVKKNIDYDEKITQRAAMIADDSLNNYFYDIIYSCLNWETKEYVTNFKIYEHTLNWFSHHIFRVGYLFLGTPGDRPTAQPPQDYYIYFVPPYGNTAYSDEKKPDEVFFIFKGNDEFKHNLRLYAAALMQRGQADEKNKEAYQRKADTFKKWLANYLSENKNTCFDIVYGGMKKRPMDVMKGNYKTGNPFKETIDLVASMLLDEWFDKKYPEFPVFKTTITIKNQAEAIRKALDRFAGRKEQLGNSMLDSFGLLSGENITIQNSKYAGYFADLLDKLSTNAVLNFNDIYYEPIPDGFIDKKYNLSYAMLPIVLLGLVYTGRAVIALKDGTMLTASNLEYIPKITNATDIYEFKHIGKPKDMQLAELARLFEVLELPQGAITDPNNREGGLEKLLAKTREITDMAAKAISKLERDFTLWGEPLIASHIAETYKQAAKHLANIFGNFQTRFNTVAKLNNFTYNMNEIEKFAADIAAVKTVMEYDAFKEGCSANANYLMNIEPLPVDENVKKLIENAKADFRLIRDEIGNSGKSGEIAATEVNEALSTVKDAYISFYFEEHKKHRLILKEYKRKTKLIESAEFANMKRLTAIAEILPVHKLTNLELEATALKVCYELTPEHLKTSHFCPKCRFQLGNNDPQVNGLVDNLYDRVEKLTAEWTETLRNAISDPLISEQKKFLPQDQRETINRFERDNTLPETIDLSFVTAVKSLLKGFETVTLDGTDLINKLTALGACDIDTLKQKFNAIIAEISQNTDKSKLRIIIRG